MPIKNYKPNTPGTRGMSTLINDEITTRTPEKSLLVKKSKTGGRNNQGKITVRHIGGGARQKYRLIDFKRNKDGIEGRAPVGRAQPMTPWGKPALGLKTRKTKKISEKFIMSRRKK